MIGTKCDAGPDVEMEVGGFNLPVTISPNVLHLTEKKWVEVDADDEAGESTDADTNKRYWQ